MCTVIHAACQNNDMSLTIRLITQYWKENMPNAVEAGRVKLQGSLIPTFTVSRICTTDI